MSLNGNYLFLLGLACGVTFLPVSAYLRVSPQRVRWLLVMSGILIVTRYVALANAAMDRSASLESAARFWFGSMAGFTLPSVFAVDALIRHPAMTPKKLLRGFSPFLAAYAALFFLAQGAEVTRPDGTAFALNPFWRMVAVAVQAVFALGFVGLCLLLIQKIPVPSVRGALFLLVIVHAYLGVVSALIAIRGWELLSPFVLPEMFTLVAIWYAFQTAARLQGGS